jgi:TPR repeat protein
MDCVGYGCHNLNKREIETLTKVKKMYARAALLGSSVSARLLGMLYNRGLGIAFPKDYKLSEFWLHFAIDLGSKDLTCPFFRGLMYTEGGFGLDINEAKGKGFLRFAADKGHDGAQFFLGTIMRSGTNLKEREEGVRLLQMSASQENIDALCDVGMIQYEGKLGERSLPKAFFCFRHLPNAVPLWLCIYSADVFHEAMEFLKTNRKPLYGFRKRKSMEIKK